MLATGSVDVRLVVEQLGLKMRAAIGGVSKRTEFLLARHCLSQLAPGTDANASTTVLLRKMFVPFAKLGSMVAAFGGGSHFFFFAPPKLSVGAGCLLYCGIPASGQLSGSQRKPAILCRDVKI